MSKKRERADESEDGEKEKRAKTNEELKDLIEKTYERGEGWKIDEILYNECRERRLDVAKHYSTLFFATILGDGTVDGQLKIIAATGVATTTDVDFIDSAGTTATVTFQAVGESVSCIYDGTGSKWHIIAYGATGTGSNIVGTQDAT